VTQAQHDLVVLSLGIVPDWRPEGYCQVSTGSDGFIKTAKPKIAPSLTEMEGVFVAGAAAGPKDIVDSIAEAGAAAMEAAKYLTATNSPQKAVA
jgi:heterodisulfide reductase subunit A